VPFAWALGPGDGAGFFEPLKHVTDNFPSHVDYFKLCLAAHYSTVGSFVPTDVDNQIRYRLWHPLVPAEDILAMAEWVMQARRWDPRPLSTRWVENSASDGRPLSGHDGEWFSVAVAAYAATRRKSAELSDRVLSAIETELAREAAVVRTFIAEENGIELLKASTLIAHNLGDLNRVIEMWNLSADDPLVKIATQTNPWLECAGRLNKLFMAEENHRHFALRGPKGLRQYADLLLPIGPFFDEWGSTVASHAGLAVSDLKEIATGLIDGWIWLAEKRGEKNQVTTGYARALAGMAERYKGGLSALAAELPSSLAKRLRSGALCNLLAVDRARFEAQWRKRGLNALSPVEWRSAR